MRVRQLVAQGHTGGMTLAAEMSAALHGLAFDKLDVAVAYATSPGLEALRSAIGGWPEQMRWVVGLDDAITQPAAIDALIKLPNSQVSLASLSPTGRRFHPKLYCLWSSTDPSACLTVIGSANMTLHGLNKNGEIGVILIADTPIEAAMLKDAWEQMNALGSDWKNWDLSAYRAIHEKARKARKTLARDGIAIDAEAEEEIAATPVFNGHPSQATVAWTEGASPSAGGRDLEFPRSMMPFFHLTRTPTVKRFRMANQQTFDMTFTMRKDNQMWRLMFSGDAIFAGIGRQTLRPVAGNTNRSDLAIVFSRASNGANFDVAFAVIGSAQHAALLAQSKAIGVLERTRNPGGRYFGYY